MAAAWGVLWSGNEQTNHNTTAKHAQKLPNNYQTSIGSLCTVEQSCVRLWSATEWRGDV